MHCYLLQVGKWYVLLSTCLGHSICRPLISVPRLQSTHVRVQLRVVRFGQRRSLTCSFYTEVHHDISAGQGRPSEELPTRLAQVIFQEVEVTFHLRIDEGTIYFTGNTFDNWFDEERDGRLLDL